MQEQEKTADLIADLEQRIDTMQDMGDAELGTFSHSDWLALILISIVIPVIVIVVAR